nr:class I SAM-dependent methyltransferase [Nakamurella flavida]
MPAATLDTLVDALRSVRDGDREAALEHARSVQDRSLLGRALADHLLRPADEPVYDSPAAFQAFVRGGGNIELYDRTVDVLAGSYRSGTLLDIGCGDGRALVPALLQAGDAAPDRVDLVEPSEALLRACRNDLSLRFPDLPVRAAAQGLTEALADPDTADVTWDLAQSTFALQSVEPDERAACLRALAPRVGELVVVDFDVDHPPAGSDAHLRDRAERWERGLAEYDADRALVAQGFLVPVLLGQIAPADPSTARTNWEHPAAHWAQQVTDAGFTDVRVERLCDYWSSPAFVLRATGSR